MEENRSPEEHIRRMEERLLQPDVCKFGSNIKPERLPSPQRTFPSPVVAKGVKLCTKFLGTAPGL
jgi:hypothetical protein